ncbi:MAG: DoxX family protein [Proteobacteria bacterium]|nr:DoxX family protein [Pseudomonadota bacterium]
MTHLTSRLASLQPYALALLRIVAGYTYLLHGTAKLFGLPHIERFDGLSWLSLMGVAGMLETVGGTLLVLGLFTRPVAFVLSGMMAVAYFMAHASAGTVLLPLLNGGEPAVLFCFVFLYLATAGGGAWALDRARR